MRRISLFVLCLTLLSSFTVCHIQASEENNFVDVVSIGSDIEVQDNKAIVSYLKPDGAAALAGVKIGDIIVSLDGSVINSRKTFFTVMANKRVPETIPMVVNRRGTTTTFNVELKTIKKGPTAVVISRHINIEDKRMTLAVIVSDVKNTFPNVPRDWAASTRDSLLLYTESTLLDVYGKVDNFSIVDRSKLKYVLEELSKSQSGIISDKSRVNVGKMTGATHIMDISFSRNMGANNLMIDKYSWRLIEVESGKVLAVDRQTVDRQTDKDK